MVLGKLPVPGHSTIWMIVGQGPIVLAVGAGGGCLDIFTLYLFSFSLSLGDGPILTEILSERAVKPKTTSQQTNQPFFYLTHGSFHITVKQHENIQRLFVLKSMHENIWLVGSIYFQKDAD